MEGPPQCRSCLQLDTRDALITPCDCKQPVHRKCLDRLRLEEDDPMHCEACGSDYEVEEQEPGVLTFGPYTVRLMVFRDVVLVLAAMHLFVFFFYKYLEALQYHERMREMNPHVFEALSNTTLNVIGAYGLFFFVVGALSIIALVIAVCSAVLTSPSSASNDVFFWLWLCDRPHRGSECSNSRDCDPRVALVIGGIVIVVGILFCLLFLFILVGIALRNRAITYTKQSNVERWVAINKKMV